MKKVLTLPGSFLTIVSASACSHNDSVFNNALMVFFVEEYRLFHK